MRKTFATDDHRELIENAGGSVFQFFDESDRITKSASDVIGKADIEAHKPPKGHFGVHLIALGAEEDMGANRNADAWSRESLRKHHQTFVKHGHVFREHRNRCARTQGFGNVALAKWNEPMKRVELIVHVDKEKAPDMYKKAKAGEELSWSMSCSLPFDRCNCCDNKAKTRAQYCSHLKNNMLQYVPEFRKYAYARNEDNVKFFDISEVKKRADRIATYLGYSFADEDMMAKAASDEVIIGGAEWAAANNPVEVVHLAPWEIDTLEKLASAVEFVRAAPGDMLGTLSSIAPSNLSKDQLDKLAEADFRGVSYELAKRAMFLRFEDFVSMVTDIPVDELRKDATFRDIEGLQLPSLFHDMLAVDGSACGEELANAVTPDECGCRFSPKRDSIDALISQVGNDLGMTPQPVQQRVINITIVKRASVRNPELRYRDHTSTWQQAAKEAYGLYLVKAAHIAKEKFKHEGNPNVMYRGIAAMLCLND